MMFLGGEKMGRKPRKSARRIMIWVAFLMIFAFFAVHPGMAATGRLEPKRVHLSPQVDRAEDLEKILEVLERKMGGKKLSKKAKDKLFTLNEDKARLIISLCDRITDDGRTVGAEIAYLLITALIVLS